ncbi:MAG TPA: hypothetical protein VF981_18350 [Gemmatimonadaceae bacterium]
MRNRPIAALVVVLALSACGTNPSSSASAPSASSATPSLNLSSLHPCDYIANEDVRAIIPGGVGAGAEHLSALPGFRDCVFSGGASADVMVGLRQAPTAAASAEALVSELFPSEGATRVTVGQLPARYLSCAHAWIPCRPAIAFVSEPYFFVIGVRFADANEDVAIALASAVLANLNQ